MTTYGSGLYGVGLFGGAEPDLGLEVALDGGADDTETINISRGAGTVERPVVYTFQGGDYTSAANWT